MKGNYYEQINKTPTKNNGYNIHLTLDLEYQNKEIKEGFESGKFPCKKNSRCIHWMVRQNTDYYIIHIELVKGNLWLKAKTKLN